MIFWYLSKEGEIMSFAERLKRILAERNIRLTRLCADTGISYHTMQSIIKRNTNEMNISVGIPLTIAQYLKIDLHELLGVEPTAENGQHITPKATRLLSGFDRLNDTGQDKAIERTEELTEIPRFRKGCVEFAEEIRPKLVTVRVADIPSAAGLGNPLDTPQWEDLQFPERDVPYGTDFGIRISGDSMTPEIHDGSIVFVKATPEITHGQIGIFVLDGEAFCKRFVVEQGECAKLVSANPAYADIVLSEHILARTVGRVLGMASEW